MLVLLCRILVVIVCLPPTVIDRLERREANICFWDPSKNKALAYFLSLAFQHLSCIVISFCYIRVCIAMRKQFRVRSEIAHQQKSNVDAQDPCTSTKSSQGSSAGSNENRLRIPKAKFGRPSGSRLPCNVTTPCNVSIPCNNNSMQCNVSTQCDFSAPSNVSTQCSVSMQCSVSTQCKASKPCNVSTNYDLSLPGDVNGQCSVSAPDLVNGQSIVGTPYNACMPRNVNAHSIVITPCNASTLSNVNASSNVSSSGSSSKKSKQRKLDNAANLERIKQEKTIFITMSCIIIAYVIFWVPFNVVFTLSFVSVGSVSPTLYTVTFCMTYLNSSFNPLLYAFSNKEFRTVVIRVITCKFLQ